MPDGVSGLTICVPGGSSVGWRAYAFSGDEPDLRREINSTYPHQVAPAGCTVAPSGRNALLTFRYPDRGDVVVAIAQDCSNDVPVPTNDGGFFATIEYFFVDRV